MVLAGTDWEAERRGTELVSPVGGRSHKEPDGGGDEPVRLDGIRCSTSTPWQLGVRCVPRDMGQWQSTRMRMRLSGWR